MASRKDNSNLELGLKLSIASFVEDSERHQRVIDDLAKISIDDIAFASKLDTLNNYINSTDSPFFKGENHNKMGIEESEITYGPYKCNNMHFTIETFKTSGNNLDCLIHSFLMTTCPAFRNRIRMEGDYVSIECGALQFATWFRRRIVPRIIGNIGEKGIFPLLTLKKRSDIIEELKSDNTVSMLSDDILDILSAFYKINFVYFVQGGYATRTYDGRDSGNLKNIYIISNPGKDHFEAAGMLYEKNGVYYFHISESLAECIVNQSVPRTMANVRPIHVANPIPESQRTTLHPFSRLGWGTSVPIPSPTVGKMGAMRPKKGVQWRNEAGMGPLKNVKIFEKKSNISSTNSNSDNPETAAAIAASLQTAKPVERRRANNSPGTLPEWHKSINPFTTVRIPATTRKEATRRANNSNNDNANTAAAIAASLQTANPVGRRPANNSNNDNAETLQTANPVGRRMGLGQNITNNNVYTMRANAQRRSLEKQIREAEAEQQRLKRKIANARKTRRGGKRRGGAR